ncbi:MAG: polyphosphate polymerase domain-containing protein [Chloroflexi bacterium]|nr:polyphosphate polymerase domain-containing protein [Chloroflexota bacterium]
MSKLNHTLRKFDRFELKYLVSLKAANEFKKSLSAYLVPDNHGDTSGSYYLSSLYYDSPDFRFYQEKVDGIKFRRKLRIRHYESRGPLSDNTLVFVEIKQRVNRVTQKRRVVLPYCAALQLCDQRDIPKHAPEDAAVIDEIICMLWQSNLRPASIVRYSRQALVGTEYDAGLRVTFDNDLSYQIDHLELHEEPNGLPLFKAGWTIIEIKINERMPYWLTELIALHNLNLVRISKYCKSIELAREQLMHSHPLADYAWRI